MKVDSTKSVRPPSVIPDGSLRKGIFGRVEIYHEGKWVPCAGFSPKKVSVMERVWKRYDETVAGFKLLVVILSVFPYLLVPGIGPHSHVSDEVYTGLTTYTAIFLLVLWSRVRYVERKDS